MFTLAIGFVSTGYSPTSTTSSYEFVPGPGIGNGTVQKKVRTNRGPTRCYAFSSVGQTIAISVSVTLYRIQSFS